MFQPTNEQGTIFVFAAQAEKAGWKIIEIGCPFPDATLEYKGEVWKVEFEYLASNFFYHRHDCRMCDLIICWENDYPESTLPIIALRDPYWAMKPIVRADSTKKEVEYWKLRSQRAESRLKRDDRRSDTIEVEPKVVKLSKITAKAKIQQRRNMIFQHIKMNGDPGPTALSEQFSVDRGTIYGDLKAMEKAGIVHQNGAGWTPSPHP